MAACRAWGSHRRLGLHCWVVTATRHPLPAGQQHRVTPGALLLGSRRGGEAPNPPDR